MEAEVSVIKQHCFIKTTKLYTFRSLLDICECMYKCISKCFYFHYHLELLFSTGRMIYRAGQYVCVSSLLSFWIYHLFLVDVLCVWWFDFNMAYITYKIGVTDTCHLHVDVPSQTSFLC